jgi:hypothetical protein
MASTKESIAINADSHLLEICELLNEAAQSTSDSKRSATSPKKQTLILLADQFVRVRRVLLYPPIYCPEKDSAAYAAWVLAEYRPHRGVSAFFDTKFENLYRECGFWELSDGQLQERFQHLVQCSSS